MLLTVVVILTLFAGCNNKEEKIENYSYGLNDDGFYINLDKYPHELPDFKKLSFTCEEVLKWGVTYIQSSDQKTEVKTIDDYVYLYGNELLILLDLAGKESVEEKDIVSASLEFYVDDKKLDQYDSTYQYEASKDGDSIVSSFIGHKAKDEYEVKYTFPKDDKEYANKEATVKVKINSITMPDPIKSGVVEKNLDKIKEHVEGVTNVETFLHALKPKLAISTLELFVSDYISNNIKLDVPEEYVEYEVHRLKYRLQQIGYTYEEYLDSVSMTDQEARDYCAMLATENYLSMLVAKKYNLSVTNKMMKDYYGNNLAYVAEVQGEPYMKLNILRDLSLYEIADLVILTFDGEVVDRSEPEDDQEKEDSETNNPESEDNKNETTPTEPSGETTTPTMDTNSNMIN